MDSQARFCVVFLTMFLTKFPRLTLESRCSGNLISMSLSQNPFSQFFFNSFLTCYPSCLKRLLLSSVPEFWPQPAARTWHSFGAAFQLFFKQHILAEQDVVLGQLPQLPSSPRCSLGPSLMPLSHWLLEFFGIKTPSSQTTRHLFHNPFIRSCQECFLIQSYICYYI